MELPVDRHCLANFSSISSVYDKGLIPGVFRENDVDGCCTLKVQVWSLYLEMHYVAQTEGKCC